MEKQQVREIKRVVKYTLFKKLEDQENLYYVRETIDGVDYVDWFIGEPSSTGEVGMADAVSSEKQSELEDEFQIYLEQEVQDKVKAITEEEGIQKAWYEESKLTTMETLQSFLNHLMNDYDHDYGTVCHAIAAGCLATISAMNRNPKNGQITGFQANAVMWQFIRESNFPTNKTGLRLINYDNMMYPQYADSFEKEITEDIWNNIQTEVKNLLELPKSEPVSERVISHWKSILDGTVPFGYSVKKQQ